MSGKKAIVKRSRITPRVLENPTLMQTHETIVDYINGRSSFMEMFAPAIFGLNSLAAIEKDLKYSDDDDDDEEEDDDSAHRPLEPHPQIKQLTEEEADKMAKELVQQEGPRKEKTERNKRKKMRKKEKKRLEKENVVKTDLPDENKEQGQKEEEEQDKCNSESQEQALIIDSNSEAKESSQSVVSQTATDGAGCDQHGENNKEEDLGTLNNHEGIQQKGLQLNNSHAASAEPIPEEACDQKPEEVIKEDRTKAEDEQHKENPMPEEACDQKPEEVIKEDRTKVEDEQPEEEKPRVPQMPEDPEKRGQSAGDEKTGDATAEELAKRSIQLAGAGNRLAASGKYQMAVKFFTGAIQYNPKEFKLFGNRSLCYERLQQFENALRDADLALSMEPNWIKGLFRKGKALCGLKRYYEASLIYREVLRLDSASAEAARELKRAQTLHLMEMGFSWAQCTEALKTHGTLEEAVEALFVIDDGSGAGGAATWDGVEQPLEREDGEDERDWVVRQMSRSRAHQVRMEGASGQSRASSHSPTPLSMRPPKPELFPVWVGTLDPTMTYVKLHELFSRAGTVYSIKMLLEQQSAFVNYSRNEDRERAIQCLNGMMVDGAPLTVRFPFKVHAGLSAYKKECFFWRTTGCMRDDCTFRHIPEHKNIDREKFTSRLGYGAQAGTHG
ncbi:uncharacterized protein ACNS7B_001073 isoform 2-T2 [Menidia menidia]